MTTYTSEAMTERHLTSGFCSGVPEMDRWLIRSALHAQAMRTARTFVWHAGDLDVVGYFSLVAHVISREELSPRQARGAPDQIPALLLAKLALDQRLQGGGLGGELLWDALSRGVEASELAGARFVVVDAIDARASAFYAHHGFVAVPGNAFRLVQKVADVAAALRG